MHTSPYNYIQAIYISIPIIKLTHIHKPLYRHSSTMLGLQLFLFLLNLNQPFKSTTNQIHKTKTCSTSITFMCHHQHSWPTQLKHQHLTSMAQNTVTANLTNSQTINFCALPKLRHRYLSIQSWNQLLQHRPTQILNLYKTNTLFTNLK